MAKKKVSKKKTNKKKTTMRKFESGATRNENESKLSLIKALCPLVIKRYIEYIGKHRRQADGNLRDWDNWKQGIPIDVYMDSDGRHFLDAWLHHDGWPEEAVCEDIEDVLCAEMFNTMGHLREILIEKRKKVRRTK